MTSRREEAVNAVYQTLAAALAARVERNTALPETVPPDGLVVVRDGSVEVVDTSLNPRTEYYSHAVEIECYVRGDPGGQAETALDALFAAAANALLYDPTLGGKVEALRLGAPEFEPLHTEGARPVLAARFPVFVEYAAQHPYA